MKTKVILAVLVFDMFTYGSMNLFPPTLFIVDIVANAIVGGAVGGVAGLIPGMGKKETT
jgi:hypothetical protein